MTRGHEFFTGSFPHSIHLPPDTGQVPPSAAKYHPPPTCAALEPSHSIAAPYVHAHQLSSMMFSSSIFACPSAIINDVQPIIVLWLVTTASASDLRPGASFRLRAAPGREPHNRWGHGRGASPASDGRADSPCQASSPGRHVGGRINKHHQHRPTSAVGRPTAAPSASDPWGEFPTSSARRKARGASALPVNEGLPTVTGGERAGPAGIRCSGAPRPTLGQPS